MERRPQQGTPPLDPPSAVTAQAYLDESVRVVRWREERIDRRSAARLRLFEGVGLSVYITALMLVFPPRMVAATRSPSWRRC
ncbi:hypothetical protein [Microbacterium sp. NPDC058345]|uniref:hypothetical protein n=1 Tax=Microbacterium sp. NPDC058345 TaxID=3346455 RepID=UPI00365818A1